MNVSRMNETDVREVIVRPFIESLGYKFGTEAHIRTEVTLRYSKAFLGRKNPSRDPDLQGRADYICEVVPHGRWVVEVKAPNVDLSLDDSQQAHTYATHPEIAALFYLITNGIEWRLYQIGKPERPVFSWDHDQTENVRPVVENILSPTALMKRSKFAEIDTKRPLAKGLNSTATVNGGYVTYAKTRTNNIMFDNNLKSIDGMRAPITSGYARRTEQGTIEAGISMLNTYSTADSLLQRSDDGVLIFATTSEMISADKNSPTIFTNLVKMDFEKGAQMPPMFGNPGGIVPASLSMAAFTQAVGYIEEGRFKGTFEVSMLCEVETSQSVGLVARIFADQLNGIGVTSVGDFDLSIS